MWYGHQAFKCPSVQMSRRIWDMNLLEEEQEEDRDTFISYKCMCKYFFLCAHMNNKLDSCSLNFIRFDKLVSRYYVRIKSFQTKVLKVDT